MAIVVTGLGLLVVVVVAMLSTPEPVVAAEDCAEDCAEDDTEGVVKDGAEDGAEDGEDEVVGGSVAELDGTTFPSDVITQPGGRVEESEPDVLEPMPPTGTLAAEVEEAAVVTAVVVKSPAPPRFPFTDPPEARIDCQDPEASP